MTERATKKLIITELYKEYTHRASEVFDPNNEYDDGLRDAIDLAFFSPEHYTRIQDIIHGKKTTSNIPVDKPIPPDTEALRISLTSKWGRKMAIQHGWV
jgi:hypothetical protein